MKLAIVHDWIKDLSGAERVLIELHKMYPAAPIYTLFYDAQFVKKWLPGANIRPSFLQRFPLFAKYYWLFSVLMPSAIESFDFSGFDTVLSSSAIFSKGLILKPSTRHICYCYSPSRLLWDQNTTYKKGKIFRHILRLWDRPAADRVDQFVAISRAVQDRIKKYYRRDSLLVYPPVSIRSDTQGKLAPLPFNPQSFYLIVSRLYDYKNIGIAIEAFNKIGYPLVIIGVGPAYDKLRSQITNPKQIQLLRFVPDDQLAQYYAHCRAFIMPQEEDFGIAPIEAMMYGKPVLALRKGGAIETVVEGVTGEFFDDPIPEALADGLRRLNENYSNYNSVAIEKHASQYSVGEFRKQIKSLIS